MDINTSKLKLKFKDAVSTAIPARNCIILIGFPGSTKSTFAKQLQSEIPKSVIISRDVHGGKTIDGIPLINKLPIDVTVILDNTNLSMESRQPFINEGYHITFIYLDSSIDDCQIRVLQRQYDNYGQLYLEGNEVKKTDVFPISVLFKARKALELPMVKETIIVPSPLGIYTKFPNKGLFLDIDGTLRKTDHLEHGYPTDPSQSELLYSKELMLKTLEGFKSRGFLLIGISNQSGIYSGKVTEIAVQQCFSRLKEQLGIEFPILYCPHKAIPISCYCRKPQVGNVILAINEFKINPLESILVGDRTTDKTCALKCGMEFIYAYNFFKS